MWCHVYVESGDAKVIKTESGMVVPRGCAGVRIGATFLRVQTRNQEINMSCRSNAEHSDYE